MCDVVLYVFILNKYIFIPLENLAFIHMELEIIASFLPVTVWHLKKTCIDTPTSLKKLESFVFTDLSFGIKSTWTLVPSVLFIYKT